MEAKQFLVEFVQEISVGQPPEKTARQQDHRQSVFGLASCWLGFCSFLGLFYAVSSSPHDFVFTASDDLLTCSKKFAVKVSFVFVVWKETCN